MDLPSHVLMHVVMPSMPFGEQARASTMTKEAHAMFLKRHAMDHTTMRLRRQYVSGNIELVDGWGSSIVSYVFGPMMGVTRWQMIEGAFTGTPMGSPFPTIKRQLHIYAELTYDARTMPPPLPDSVVTGLEDACMNMGIHMGDIDVRVTHVNGHTWQMASSNKENQL